MEGVEYAYEQGGGAGGYMRGGELAHEGGPPRQHYMHDEWLGPPLMPAGGGIPLDGGGMPLDGSGVPPSLRFHQQHPVGGMPPPHMDGGHPQDYHDGVPMPYPNRPSPLTPSCPPCRGGHTLRGVPPLGCTPGSPWRTQGTPCQAGPTSARRSPGGQQVCPPGTWGRPMVWAL